MHWLQGFIFNANRVFEKTAKKKLTLLHKVLPRMLPQAALSTSPFREPSGKKVFFSEMANRGSTESLSPQKPNVRVQRAGTWSEGSVNWDDLPQTMPAQKYYSSKMKEKISIVKMVWAMPDVAVTVSPPDATPQSPAMENYRLSAASDSHTKNLEDLQKNVDSLRAWNESFPSRNRTSSVPTVMPHELRPTHSSLETSTATTPLEARASSFSDRLGLIRERRKEAESNMSGICVRLDRKLSDLRDDFQIRTAST
jgi:hypothetical protein